MRRHRSVSTLLVILTLTVLPALAQGQSPNRVGEIRGSASEIEWSPTVEHESIVLTVSAPDGAVYEKEFARGKRPSFGIADIPGTPLDGSYTYELRVVPHVPPGLQARLLDARERGSSNEVLRLLFEAGLSETVVQSGGLMIEGGRFVPVDQVETTAGNAGAAGVVASASGTGGRGRAVGGPGGNGSGLEGPIGVHDQVIPDDLIVQGSLCVGIDCVNGEAFDFDTIRMKENNTRIQFDDTSSATGFSTNNWQIRANASASGGLNFLGFIDQGATGNSETGTLVLGAEAGAAANSLWVDSTSRVGFRTATPVLDLHIATSNTPGHRLEQNNSGGFTAQTWDIAGNEANFF
ncbi:MAG TPA: hypothetical protein VMS56_08920, partial [Thermoanaerobaculia bacterium]|nr:hypothetical protein [Thermoanaerobaculia bacterium]